MKNFLALSCLLLSLIANGQSKLILWDAVNNKPIEDVYVYSTSEQLLAISNESGEVQLLPESFPVFISAYNYESKQITAYSDTVWLEPKFRLLEEVSVQGKLVPANELYDRIRTTSHRAALNDTNSGIAGTYFEAALIIDLITNDSVFIAGLCDLEIRKIHSKENIAYQFFASNGERTFHKQSDALSLDTADIESWLRVLPTFSSLLQYDLSNEKKYRLNFRDAEVERKPCCLTLTEKGRHLSKMDRIYYQNDTLIAYEYASALDCREANGVSVCFELNNRIVHFNRDEEGYFMENGTLYAIFRMTVNDKKILIKIKKGFIENQTFTQSLQTPVDQPENYLKNMPYAENVRLMHLFTFPNK